MPEGILSQLPLALNRPAPDDIDNDGMFNAWEACYSFNFRDPSDGDIVIPLPANATVEQTAAAQAALARMKDGNLVREYPLTYTSGGYFTEAEWKAMNRVDPDHDGLPNNLECEYDHDPRIPDWADTKNRDSDGDGFSNGEELLAGTNYLSAQSHPAFTLEIVSETNNQSAPAMSALTKPLTVRVKYDGTNDGVANPTPRAGIPLNFACVTVTGTQFADALSEQVAAMKDGPLNVVTDALGLAAVHVQMPPAPGTILAITATYPANTAKKVSFKATVLAPVIGELMIEAIKGAVPVQTVIAGRRADDARTVRVMKSWRLPSGHEGISPVAGMDVFFTTGPGGIFLSKTGTQHPGTYTLATDDLGIASVRFIAPSTPGRAEVRASIGSELSSALFQMMVQPVPITGGGTGPGGPGGYEADGTWNPDKPNPAYILVWQAPLKAARVRGSLQKLPYNWHKTRLMESRLLEPGQPILGVPNTDSQSHFSDDYGVIVFNTYDPNWDWQESSDHPPAWGQLFNKTAPVQAESKISGGFPAYDSVLPVSATTQLELAKSNYTRNTYPDPEIEDETRTTVISEEMRRKARLVAISSDTGIRIGESACFVMALLELRRRKYSS